MTTLELITPELQAEQNLLDKPQAVAFVGVSQPTFDKFRKAGKLSEHWFMVAGRGQGPGARPFFLLSELEIIKNELIEAAKTDRRHRRRNYNLGLRDIGAA